MSAWNYKHCDTGKSRDERKGDSKCISKVLYGGIGERSETKLLAEVRKSINGRNGDRKNYMKTLEYFFSHKPKTKKSSGL